MPEQTNVQENVWNVLLVEDEETVRRQVREFLSGEFFASRRLSINEIIDFDQALNLIHERKADLVILDIYRGTAREGGEQAGIRVLESIERSGFVAVVLYTALPEGLEGQQSSFVRLVGKDTGGLEQLRAEITDLFRIRVPQVHRAVVNHLDRAMCSYMWEFVQARWTEFLPFIDKPEFLRLVVQRLALTFSREGISRMITEVYGAVAIGHTSGADTVHPAEYFIKPPIGQDPMFGDIRLRLTGGTSEYLVVLWPSCDMIPRRESNTGQIKAKTEHVLCAQATKAKDAPEVADWLTHDASETKRKKVERLVKNTRDESPERYHFLPGVWDIPDLVVDFQKLEHVALDDVKVLSCLATLASPFAEALGSRFQRYVGRIGTPDLDVTAVMDQIKNRAAPAAESGTSTR